MAASDSYAVAGLKIGATNHPCEPDSITLNGDLTVDELRTAGELKTSLAVVTKKRPQIEAGLFNVGALTALDTIASAGPVQAFWRQREKDATFAAAYLSAKFTKGIIFPVSLTGGPDRKALLTVRALGSFVAGTAYTIAAETNTVPAVTLAYYPKHIIVGADTILNLAELSVNWEHDVQDDNQLEPAYYVVHGIAMTGTARILDIASALNTSRLQNGVKETTLDIVFEDRGPATGPDVTVSLGNAFVETRIEGNEATVSFRDVV